MKRNGYTIAEALITMAIIGVVAALTLPTFISKYRKQVYAASLASAVSNFENAMTALMMKEGVDDLLDTEAWRGIEVSGAYALSNETTAATIKKFMANIAKVMPFDGYETDKAYYKQLATPTSNTTVSYGAPVRFRTKGGVEYMIYIVNVSKSKAKSEVTMLASNSNYMNKAAEVYIDINGENAPNVIGRDYFRFELGNDGRLYPYGGKDWAVYNSSTYASPKTKCVTNKEGYYCAAYLMENGYKMDY